MIEKFRSLRKSSQRLLILTIVLLLYGYLCRLLNVYFFWESKAIGWSLVCLSVIFLMRERLQFKKSQEKGTVSERIAIGLMIFVLSVQALLFIEVPHLDAYKIARLYLQTDKAIVNKVGVVKSISLIPLGGFEISTTGGGESGKAEFNFIVKGESKFKDFRVFLYKEESSDWRIVYVR